MNTASRYKILVMDDEPLNLKLLSVLLEPDYDVVTTMTGQETLDILKNETFDLIILDIMMPDINGYDVCRHIRSVKETQLTPIIMITALSRKEDKIKGIEAGADEFLSKPIDYLEVQTRVNTLIEKSDLQKSIIGERHKSQRYLDISGCIMVGLGLDHRIEMANRKCCEVLGYNEMELLGQDWFDLLTPDDTRDQLKQDFENSVLDNSLDIEEIEYSVVTRSGDLRLINWKGSFVRDIVGNTESVLISGNDVTEERRVQNLLQDRSDNLEFSNNLKELLFDVMKYDLLTPAESVISFVDSLLEIEENTYKEQMLENIKITIENMGEKVKEISSYTRMNSYSDLDTRKQNIAAVLNDIIDFSGFESLIKNVEVDAKLEGTYNAYLNSAVKDIFSNMLSNSVMRSPEDSVVSIRIVDNNDSWRVEFADKGSKDYEIPVDPFNGVKTADFESVAQGFSINKRVIELYGGDMGITDNPEGKGLIFWVSLKKADLSKFKI